MPGAKTPAPYCSHSNPVSVEDGTSCRIPSPAPVPLGTTANSGISGHHSQRHSPSTIVNGIIQAATWRDLERWAEVALGPSSFYLGICYGILENLAGSVAGLVDLLRVFILAGLYERAQHPAWAVAGVPEYLIAKAADLVFPSQLKKAHDQCETLMRELKYAVTHPGELFGSIKNEYAAKWKRFQTLVVDVSLSSQFEAGKIAGGVLLDVLMLIGVGEAAVKFAAKLPELAKLAERFGEALKVGSRVGGAAEKAEVATVRAGRIAAKPSTAVTKASPITETMPGDAADAGAASVGDGGAGGGGFGRKWNFGGHKSSSKWANQMAKRGWTPRQIDGAVEHGQRFPAPNDVNPGNPATRYVHPSTGRSVVIDNVTGELLHVGGDGFRY